MMSDGTVSGKIDIVGLKNALPEYPNLKLKSGNEYCGSCPKCGGVDRFCVWVDTGKFWCRGCEWKGDKVDYYMHITSTDLKELAANYLEQAPKIKPKLIKVYDYHNKNGEVVYQSCRFEPGKNGAKKSFSQRRPDGNGGYTWTLHGVERVLYNLTGIVNAKTVFFVEGEKDVDRLKSMGLAATTCGQGASSWNKFKTDYLPYLTEKNLILLPDNDKSGLELMTTIAQDLNGKSPKKLIQLPGLLEKQDISDWLDAGKTKEELLKLVADAPLYKISNPIINQKLLPLTEWQEPTPLKSDTPDAPKFPIECLPKVMGDYAIDEAERMQVPVDFIAIPMLIALAGAIGKEPHIKPKKYDDAWMERACLWGVVISPKSEMKSPSQKIALSPLRKIESDMMENYKKELETWESEQDQYKIRFKSWNKQCEKLTKNDIDADLPGKPEQSVQPTTPRILTNDATIEKLSELMQKTQGLTLVRDELSGFMLNMNRYNAGSDRQYYLECKSGGSFSVDRMGRPSLHIKDLYLNIFGTIQPAVATKIFGNGESDDGFFERFQLLSYPESLEDYKIIERYQNSELKKEYTLLLQGLFSAEWLNLKTKDFDNIKYCEFDEESQHIFNAWLLKHMVTLKSMDEDNPIKGFMGKSRGLLVQLALLFHLSGMPSEQAIVKSEPLLKAIMLVEDYFFPMWDRILKSFGQSKTGAGSLKILNWIKKENRKDFTMSELIRNHWTDLKMREQIEPALSALIENNYISDEKQLTIKCGKGKKKVGYMVNPKIND